MVLKNRDFLLIFFIFFKIKSSNEVCLVLSC